MGGTFNCSGSSLLPTARRQSWCSVLTHGPGPRPAADSSCHCRGHWPVAAAQAATIFSWALPSLLPGLLLDS